ncbi:MAG: hypothetical protein ACJ8F3_05725 [Xanthobacteraceae bacterium]
MQLINEMSELATIPVFDLRECGVVGHTLSAPESARTLREDCLSWLSPAARGLVPALDAVTRRWIEHSRSPYLAEIRAIANGVGLPGIWFLNGSYQWGCTAAARDENGAPWLVRTLDWPFPGLGRHLAVMRMRGPAGEFLNVSWVGYAGVLTAVAPRRFAAAINQAPLRRRTHAPWLRPFDIAANALHTWSVRFCPPDHLLRHVFETCENFAEARRKLETEPVARPVIFTLTGCQSGERCVIERTEEGYATRVDDTAAANDWLDGSDCWEARINTTHLLTRTYQEARERSRLRREALVDWPHPFAEGGFAWLTPPVLNVFTRLAVEMSPQTGTLRAIGYEPYAGSGLPRPATHTRTITGAAPPELRPLAIS